MAVRQNWKLGTKKSRNNFSEISEIWVFDLPFFHFAKKFFFNILTYRNSRSQMFFKIVVLKNFAIFTGKHLCWSLFLHCKACNVIKKETPKQVLSCEYCEVFKNSFFYRTPPVAPSKIRQFCTLYPCYAFFSKPFKVFFSAAKIYNFQNITMS